MAYAVEIYGSASRLGPDAIRLESAARDLAATGVPIRYIGSVALPRDEMVFYLFEAGSKDLVDDLLGRLGIVAERIVEAVATSATFGRAEATSEG
jgi:hypothetical protein